eukprot:CAMPEP_0172459634 /NCGR_PEP_ID=MMETSP1065-20121228/33451_1 /TAXON_ID=265537 /ORGANISM="Amphiprora paludosa, Strain CCMP125" /LENGTH=122 /DNA_ID=CAMNT_0013214385 /DNA_START=52 /DNA_END=418 /DNA_ORIENTATION=-
MTWPPPDYIEPITLSMHLGPTLYPKFRQTDPADPNATLAPFLRQHEPIGARDTKTLQFLHDSNVTALFSACLTMTLSLPPVQRNGSASHDEEEEHDWELVAPQDREFDANWRSNLDPSQLRY